MSMILCVDAGGTKTRAALYDGDGRALGRATGGGGALSLGVDVSAKQVLSLWHIIARSTQVEAHETAFVRVMAGVAGCGLPGRADALKKALGEFANVEIVPDGLGALMAAQQAGCDRVINVGTGIAGLQLSNDGWVRVGGGWGFPAGDQGSGAWLGLQLVGLLFAFIDGVGGEAGIGGAVATRLLEVLGDAPAVLQGWQKEASPADFAGLVPILVQGAHQGDKGCQRLLDEAGGHVAALVMALDRTGEVLPDRSRVALTGGLAGTLLPICRARAPNLAWDDPKLDALSGLFLLASGALERPRFAERPGLPAAQRPPSA